MAQVDLIIKNGTIVTPSMMYKASIAVKDETIVTIASNENLPASAKVIDASGLFVLPGVIDVHVHFRDPGYTYKEDFGSGTAAAAAGGVTCIFDMPNNSPPPGNVDALKKKIEAAEAKAIVDYGLYGLLTEENLEHVMPLANAGVIGYKCFMGETSGQIRPPPPGEMLDQFAQVAKTNLRVSVHAENGPILQYRIDQLRKEGRSDAHAHYESRPHIVEEEAVSRAIKYARETGCKLHIAHLTCAAGVAEVHAAKLRGQPVTAETCPHYLLLDESNYHKLGSMMKINPSIKTAEDKASLWEAILDGTVDMIATDHSPHTLEEKKKSDIFDCLSGFPGLETQIPLMLTEINKGSMSLTKYAQLTSENPARVWRLYPKKGSIMIGSDADITILDLKRTGKVQPERFLSKSKFSPFEEFNFKGSAVYTIVRGNIVMDHGRVETTPIGKMVTPLPS